VTPARVPLAGVGTGSTDNPATRRARDELPSQAPPKNYRDFDRKDQVAVI